MSLFLVNQKNLLQLRFDFGCSDCPDRFDFGCPGYLGCSDRSDRSDSDCFGCSDFGCFDYYFMHLFLNL